MPEPELIALVDLDGTLADYDGAMIRDMAKLAGPDDPPYNPRKCLHEFIAERESLIKRQPGWWYNLQPIEHNMAVVRLMVRLGFTVHVLTKGPRDKSKAWEEKVEWSRKYLPGMDITITQDKGLVYGKVLFDDYKVYLERWLQWRPRGLAIQPVASLKPEEVLAHPNCRVYDATELGLNLVRYELEAIKRATEEA